MEQNGYRLDKISHSYWFYFNESTPKEMHYFLSYKSFRGQSMGWCDYALEKNYNAHEIKSNMCFYTIYRTKEPKESLSIGLYKSKTFGKSLNRIVFGNIIFRYFCCRNYLLNRQKHLVYGCVYRNMCLHSRLLFLRIFHTKKQMQKL